MSELANTASDVRAVIRRHVPFGADRDLPDDLALGSEGLGLDSVAVVELLLACEQACGVRLAPDVFEGTAVTVGSLVAAVVRVRDRTP